MALYTENMNAKPEVFAEKRDVREEVVKICSQLKSHGVHSVSCMNTAGFQYTGDNDTARCNICGIEVSEWTREMNPFFIHLERSPNCSFVRSVQLKNNSTLSSEENLTKRQKMETNNNQYNQQKKLIESNTYQQARQRTFSHWPHQTTPAKEQMIHAGFFFTNVGDRVICTYCNLICQQWQKDIDDPIEVHKILSPKCPYVLSLLIQEETSSVVIMNGISTDNNNNQTTCTPITTNNEPLPIIDEKLLSRLVTARLDLPISQQLLHQNFKLSIIKRCWEDQLRLKHDDFVNDCDLYIACVILQKQIQYINGDKNNIIVPSIKMKSIHNNEQPNASILQRSQPSSSLSISPLTNSSNNSFVQTLETASNKTITMSTSNDKILLEETSSESQIVLNHPCVVCSREEKRLACVPCGHLVVCVNCYGTLRVCPVCRVSIEAYVRVYV